MVEHCGTSRLGRLKQEDHDFKTRLGRSRPCLKAKEQTTVNVETREEVRLGEETQNPPIPATAFLQSHNKRA